MKNKQKQANEEALKKFAKGANDNKSKSGIENCVIYTRVSTKEQMETNKSLEWQKKHCTDFAVNNNYAIKGYFGGTYESAKSDERKEFNRMLKFTRASKEKISYILVYSLDRFSRTGDSAIFIAGELQKVGVRIVSVTLPIDTNSYTGVLQQNLQFLLGKYENDTRRQKTIDGMRAKLLRGEWIGHAPTGYSFESRSPNQKIVINEFGPLIKKAFQMKSEGMSNEKIGEKLKMLGLKLAAQTLTDILKNPFYCGLMSHKHLEGELVRGNHPALIDEALFLKANRIDKSYNFSPKRANDALPLKVFVKDAQSGAPFTGYMVKPRELYYYKVNRVGARVNRSASLMHEKFKSMLSVYAIDAKLMAPLKAQLFYTYERLTESKSSEKKSLSAKLKQVDDKLYELRKRHAFGELSVDIYQEFSMDLYQQKRAIECEIEKLTENLSNPQKLIQFACELSVNLSKTWELGDYYQKQQFQNMLFPEGVFFDSEINDYRTPKINPVISYIADLSKDLANEKSRNLRKKSKNSGLVPGAGVEPAQP
jgi:site-specific DNA recombinase